MLTDRITIADGLPSPDSHVESPEKTPRCSPNEAAVSLLPAELVDHVEIVHPSRPSLTYERME